MIKQAQGSIMNQFFNVQGMTCGHCEKAIIKALIAFDPQAKIVIDRTLNKVEVDSTQAREFLQRVIAKEGYRVVA
jgi:copper chaperone